MSGKHHVITNVEGGWSVFRAGAKRAERRFATQEQAITFARKLAQDGSGDLYIHNSDGTIRRWKSYSKGEHLVGGKQ